MRKQNGEKDPLIFRSSDVVCMICRNDNFFFFFIHFLINLNHALHISHTFQRMADKTVDRGPCAGCAVLFLQSLCPDVNLLSVYKDQQEGKFIVFKVIKLTLTGERPS